MTKVKPGTEGADGIIDTVSVRAINMIALSLFYRLC